MNTNDITYTQLIRLGIDIKLRWNSVFPSAPRIEFWIEQSPKLDGHYLHIGYMNTIHKRYRKLGIRCEAYMVDENTVRIKPGCAMAPVDLQTGYDKEVSLKRSIARTEISNGVCAWIAAKYAKGELK